MVRFNWYCSKCGKHLLPNQRYNDYSGVSGDRSECCDAEAWHTNPAELIETQRELTSKLHNVQTVCSRLCYCGTGEGTFYSKTKDSKQYCTFCWLLMELKKRGGSK